MALALLQGSSCSGLGALPFELELRTVATLTSGDSVLLAASLPAIDSRGGFAALLQLPEGAVGLFDSTGAFRATVGRRGTGPGEFRSATSVGFGPGDSLWVIDRNRWAHLFEVQASPQFVRTIALTQPSTGEVTRYGFLSRGIVGTQGLRGPHLARWDGALKTEFGQHASVQRMGDRMQPVALLDSVRLWTVREGAYAFELLEADGSRPRAITFGVPWFGTTPDRDPAEGGITPHVAALRVDTAGRLMVLIRRGNPARPSLERRPVAPLERAAPATRSDLAEVYDGVLDVIDPVGGHLLASHRVSGGVLGFLPGDLLAEAAVDAQGNVTLCIKHIALRPRH